MSDYIEREAALKAVNRNYPDPNAMCAALVTIPAADVRPVVHGRWTHGKGDSRWMCSVCKGKENAPTVMGKPIVWDYCPNCGADMRNLQSDFGNANNSQVIANNAAEEGKEDE